MTTRGIKTVIATRDYEYGKKELIVTKMYDENGEQVAFYDGSMEWYSVQMYRNIDGMPHERKEFGNNLVKAKKYFNRNK